MKDFECGLLKNDPEISPSQIYAYAAHQVRRALRERRAASDRGRALPDGTCARA